jgi:hypothetical protein
MVLWTPPDIKQVAKELKKRLTKDEVNDALDELEHRHDANNGISWETIRQTI